MTDWLEPFSGGVPHPPGTVCNAHCTPWCHEGARPAPRAAEPTVPEPRSATTDIPETGVSIL